MTCLVMQVFRLHWMTANPDAVEPYWFLNPARVVPADPLCLNRDWKIVASPSRAISSPTNWLTHTC